MMRLKEAAMILCIALYPVSFCFAQGDVVATQTTTSSRVNVQEDVAKMRAWLEASRSSHGLSAPASSSFVAPSRAATSAAASSSYSVKPPVKPMTYAQSRAAMLNAVPDDAMPIDSDSQAAFNAMVQQSMPLTPRQIVKLRQLIDQSQRAAVIPATVPPRPVSSTLMVNLAPGTTPPAIRLAQGYVTSLVFVDSSGAPWPVASYDIGDPKTTTIQWDGKSNVLLVQASSPYGDSDLVIRLIGLPTPVTLELVSGQRVVDYRTDIHVAGFGPNSKELPTNTGLPPTASPVLLSVLDGVAPSGSRPLVVHGGDCKAWLLGDRMYLRTRMTVLSPGWSARMASPDGMYAYEIQASASVLVSRYGEPVELKVEGF